MKQVRESEAYAKAVEGIPEDEIEVKAVELKALGANQWGVTVIDKDTRQSRAAKVLGHEIGHLSSFINTEQHKGGILAVIANLEQYMAHRRQNQRLRPRIISRYTATQRGKAVFHLQSVCKLFYMPSSRTHKLFYMLQGLFPQVGGRPLHIPDSPIIVPP